jgi:radical SAM superfamily enzyme YgiQ (UPF0313 family)
MNNQIDVVFVEPNSSKQSYQGLADDYAAIETPTWSLLLAQSCRSKGFKVAILDCNAERLTDYEAYNRLVDLNPRLILFVVYGQNPNSGTTNMSGAIRLAGYIKDGAAISDDFFTYPTIGFVGSHSSALPKEVLQHDCVDLVFTNEGVYALHNLLAGDLNDSKYVESVKGIGWKWRDEYCDPEIIINPPERIVPQDRMVEDLPGYAWDLLPYKEKPFDLYRAHFWHTNYSHENRSPFAAIYTSFGCKFKCHFCMINILNRTDNGEDKVSSDFNTMRWWPAEFILKEFDKLYNDYGVKNIRISDEMFFLNKQHFLPIIEGLEQRNYPLNMWAYSRIDTCREDYLKRFKAVGINWLALGIEAANRNIRQEITKGAFKDVDINEVVKLIQSYGINVVGNYIFGFPNEKLEDLQKTLDLAIELNCEFANMYCAAALPGSPLYMEAKKKGLDLPSSFSEYAFYSYECKPLPTNYLSAKEVLAFRDKAWTIYNTNPKFLDLVACKFGSDSMRNIIKQAKIKLKRKLLGD